MDDQQPYRRSPHTAWQLSDDGGLLLHLRAHELSATNPTGVLVWEALAAPHTAIQLSELLMREYEVSRAEALAAVRAFLTDLEARGLIEKAAL